MSKSIWADYLSQRGITQWLHCALPETEDNSLRRNAVKSVERRFLIITVTAIEKLILFMKAHNKDKFQA